MANTNTPYIAKNAAPLVNPTSASVFLQTPNALATIAANQTPQAAYVKMEGWSAPGGAGTSNFTNVLRFVVRAAGRATGGTTTNFTPTIVFGRNTTYASNTVVGSLTATAFNSASGHWFIDASLIWDPFSGQISGTISGLAGSGGAETITASTAITPITGTGVVVPQANVNAPYSTGDQTLFFSVAALFSASNANNVCTLDFFEVENL